MNIRRVLFTVVALVMLSAVYIVIAARYLTRFAPEPHVHDFAAFQRQGLPMHRAVTISTLPGHIIVLGDPTAAWWTLASGPPAYHFDATGRLIDFTLDLGDSARFQNEYDVYHGTQVALDSLPARFARRSE